VALVLLPAAGAGAFSPPPTLGHGGCYDPTQSNADFEAYGPTDVTVQAGNNRVTVNENAAGTLTVFKYPNPSLYNQLKYFAVSRDAHGRVHTRFPNEGSFAGVRWRTRHGTGFAWLRRWRVTQRWDSSDLPVPVTRYRSPRKLGLSVTAIDLAPPGTSTFVRELWIRRARSSPVRHAAIVHFANFNPVANHIPFLPIADWCSPGSDGTAAYDRKRHAIVTSWSGTDQATGNRRSVAVAFGFDGADSSHQVGEDAYDPAAGGAGGPDGYEQARSGLGGGDSASGQTTGTLARGLRFDGRGRADARVVMTGGRDSAHALAALRGARGTSFASQLAAVHEDWRRFLRRTRLPRGAPRRVTEVAKRSLISLRLARAPATGAIVASVNTQGPYGEDWIRDGAFLNRMLDENGFTSWVTRHNRFYARVQASPANPSPVRPPGNWSMASYADGVDGAPIPWEIDETGLGTWTLYDHSTFLRGAAARAYLRTVYPAIVRSADFLTSCEDPTSGLQCVANEDDNYSPSQSLHGAETVYLGLRSALAAARAMGDTGARVSLWRSRLGRLRAAIDRLYDPVKRSYREGNSGGNAYNLDYSDGGWLLWPVRFRPYGDPTMVGEAATVARAMRTALAGPRGQYEAKALLGLAHALHGRRARSKLRRTLGYMARSLTTPSGLFGESWSRLPGGRPLPVQDMPHVWEHALFYLAALRIDGGRHYAFQSNDLFARACRSKTAPPRACRR
ncbi:MAG: glucoamylase, partial [Solirubrobacteraceae bacterium]|nr:glucoamylase [Solirubrobacteraceae bacterium]